MFLRAFVVGESIIVDARTNRASMINLCEEFQAPSVPFIAANLTAMAMFDREEGDENDEQVARFEIRTGDDLLVQASVPVQFSGLQRTRAVIEIGAFEVPRFADLNFDFVIEDKRVARWTVIVREDSSAQPIEVSAL